MGRVSLDGMWKFNRIPHPSSAPPDWADPAYKDASWKNMVVPSLWTMAEDSPDKPIYTNVLMPFRVEPPLTPDTNPTGLPSTPFCHVQILFFAKAQDHRWHHCISYASKHDHEFPG